MTHTAILGGVRLPIQFVQVDGHPTSIDYRVCTIPELGEVIETCVKLKARKQHLLISQIEDYERTAKNYKKKYRKEKQDITQKINTVLEKFPQDDLPEEEKEKFSKILEMPFKYVKKKFSEKIGNLQYSFMVGEVGKDFSQYLNEKHIKVQKPIQKPIQKITKEKKSD